MASIRKRGDRQWEARIRKKGYDPTVQTFPTKFAAEKWAREMESLMNRWGSYLDGLKSGAKIIPLKRNQG